jgi:hypothetical protein
MFMLESPAPLKKRPSGAALFSETNLAATLDARKLNEPELASGFNDVVADGVANEAGDGIQIQLAQNACAMALGGAEVVMTC